MAASKHQPRAVAIVVVPIVVAIVLTLFAWPQAKVGPRDVPVGVAGSPAVERQLAAQEGRFDVHRYGSEAAVRAAIEDREVYGGFVATPDGPKVLTASAGSPAVAQMLTHAAAEGGAAVQVEDVVASGPSGGAVPASVLPLMIAGLLTGAVAAAAGGSAVRRLGLVVAGSLLAGVAATAIVQSWLDVVGGDWVANAAGLSLTVLAIAGLAAGLAALMGKAGLLLAAATMVFVGNPFSAVGSGPEMLPEPAGAIGRLLPPRGRRQPAAQHRVLRRRRRGRAHRRTRGLGACRARGAARRGAADAVYAFFVADRFRAGVVGAGSSTFRRSCSRGRGAGVASSADARLEISIVSVESRPSSALS